MAVIARATCLACFKPLEALGSDEEHAKEAVIEQFQEHWKQKHLSRTLDMASSSVTFNQLALSPVIEQKTCGGWGND